MGEVMVRRLDVMKWLILLLFAVLISRLGYLQVVQGQNYVRLADGNRLRIVPIKAPRGIFYDRNGVPLVSKRPSFAVTVATGSSSIPDAEMAALSRILDMDVTEIRGKINRHNGFSYVPVRLKTDVDQKTISKIEENRSAFPGIVIKAQPVRKYIYQDFAAHIFGYVGEISEAELKQKKEDGYKTGDIIGKAGLEKVYDKYIRGTAGAERIEVDVNGQPVQVLDERQPVAGNDVVLTLDYSIQQAAEQAMDERLRYLQSSLHRRKAKAAAAVVETWAGSSSNAIASVIASISTCSRAMRSPALAPVASENAASSPSARVRSVLRRNSDGGKRSVMPRMTPAVSCVSTSPSTSTRSSRIGPSSAKVWVRLPKASWWARSWQPSEISMRQATTYWPSWLRGVRRRVWIAPFAGGS